jgi:hypothetical protein
VPRKKHIGWEGQGFTFHFGCDLGNVLEAGEAQASSHGRESIQTQSGSMFTSFAPPKEPGVGNEVSQEWEV